MCATCISPLHSGGLREWERLLLQSGYVVLGLAYQWVRSFHTLAAGRRQIWFRVSLIFRLGVCFTSRASRTSLSAGLLRVNDRMTAIQYVGYNEIPQ